MIVSILRSRLQLWGILQHLIPLHGQQLVWTVVKRYITRKYWVIS